MMMMRSTRKVCPKPRVHTTTRVSRSMSSFSKPAFRSKSFKLTPVSTLKQKTSVLRPKISTTVFSLKTRPVISFRDITIKVPDMGDSITDGRIESFKKKAGDFVQADEIVATIETDKVVVEVRAPEAGQILSFSAKEGDTVLVASPLFELDTSSKGAAAAPKQEAPKQEAAPKKQEAPKQEAAPKKQEVPKKQEAAPKQEKKESFSAPKVEIKTTVGDIREHRVPMSRQRLRIAERLKDSQNTYALLTTFNECDMTNLTEMKNSFKDEFQEKHGVKLGFMSTFLKASAIALQESPVINAVIDGDSIVYRDYVDISVAVATPTGLAVPVLRDVQNQSLAQLELNLMDLGARARDRKLEVSDMVGGTFTISNGGVYGSLMGTPIVNPPQSAILGMHGIFNRPMAINNQVLIRPMMYLALTYDHRLIDGRDAVLFLRRIKALVEDPRRILIA